MANLAPVLLGPLIMGSHVTTRKCISTESQEENVLIDVVRCVRTSNVLSIVSLE